MRAINVLLLVMTGCLASPSFAQDARAVQLRWNSAQGVELKSGATVASTFEIITNSTEIKINHNGRASVFQITSTTGTWSNVTQDGSLTYQLRFGEKSGTAVLSRESGAWSFTLDFSNHKDGIRQKFLLTGFSQN